MTVKPLKGVRVIDFCWVGAGSYATKLLADQGADVIKIESRARLDSLRLSAPFAGGVAGVDRSGYFADRNTNKRSCTINLKTEEGRELARRLVQDCDVVANSFSPGVMDRFGLGWEEVRAINPSVVYLAMSMQGDSGPYRDHRGFGLTISSMVGMHGLSGLPNEIPVGTGTNFPDHIPNPCHAAFAVLAALRHVRRTGQGQYIDLAQTEATISTLGTALLELTVNGSEPGPMGNRHRRHAPHGVYPCRGDDRWVAIAVTTDEQFAALGRVLGLDEPVMARVANESARLAGADELDELIASRSRSEDQVELAERLQRAGIPAGPVRDPRDLIESDPQLAERGHWVRLRHPEMGETIYNAPPFRLSETPTRLENPAPLLGQHTAEVCRDLLGMDDDEIERLTAAGVLA
jgi:benzylsuccinate CoA-transferase BbsF subunit